MRGLAVMDTVADRRALEPLDRLPPFRASDDVEMKGMLVSLLGLVAALAMWFAFQPPAVYRRFIEGRARPDADAAASPPA